MHQKAPLWKFLLPMLLLLTGTITIDPQTTRNPDVIHLVASTPGNEVVKALLGIAPNTALDFIRWNLRLEEAPGAKPQFTLSIRYGLSQPNTLGFIDGGYSNSLAGTYTVVRQKGTGADIYRLRCTNPATEILLLKVSDNIFHLLTPGMQMMTGNAGWSYTLNRKEPIVNEQAGSALFTRLQAPPTDTAQQVIFEGRTPCVEYAREMAIPVSPECIKIKWKLVLHRDPKTLQPATYTLRRVGRQVADVTGKWTISRGIASNPDAIVYQLQPKPPAQPLSLLLADEQVAFVLRNNKEPFVGNEHFSYTLNRRQPD